MARTKRATAFPSNPSYHKLDYDDEYELGPGEIVRVNADSQDHIPARR
ncbi:MAG: hypothetical protein ACLTQI_06080 [Slackia sp.]